jgi:uncharacterized membrane protein (UPF0182 family)
MRTPADLPRRMPRASRRTRIIVVAAVVAVIVAILSLSGLARFWTDYLWFQSVGFTSVFRGVLLTKVVLALVFMAIFFLMMWGNLVIADRVAPDQAAPGTADELVVRYREVVSPHARWVRIATAAIFALLAGIGANRQWNNWDLLRYHVSFGTADPEYHIDIGFYVFDLPFIKFLLGWTFEALIVVFIVTTVAHYLNGGIHVQGPERRITPAVKTHLSVLLGVLALIKAVDYYFERLELVLSRDHLVNGATATSVHADKPALTLLIAIAVIAAGLFLYNIRQKGWMLPAVAVALWILVYVLVGLVYPALYQALRVNPSQLSRETPYINRNISATRDAFGINQVMVNSPSATNRDQVYNYSPTVTSAQIQGNSPQAVANQQTLANVRMLDPAVQLTNTFDKYQGQYSYYNFNDLAQDRYQLPDPSSPNSTQETATIASVRELNTSLPSSGFVAQHLQYTHGYGAVLAPISESGVNADGTPNFSLSDLPPTGTPPLGGKSGQGSEIYYGVGNATGGYVIADSKTDEIDYQSSTNGQPVYNRYAGSGGVEAGSIVRRAAFALRFGDANFILSGQITPSSRVMYYRNITTMVRKAAPFLKYDSDPYAVIVNQNVYWILDAYTTTDNYPYAQNANTTGMPAGSGLNSTFNYARNSVKVVINAYSGKMYFFVVDNSDPIIQVYEKAFPDLFIPAQNADGMIKGITDHFRYPEDLFRVQTTMYGRYHLTDPAQFYSGAEAWSVSPDPGSGQLSSSSSYLAPTVAPNGQVLPAQVARLAPQYILAHPPGSTQQSFMTIIPYVPVGSATERQNLTAWMTASSDWGSGSNNRYGTLTVYETPTDQTVDGPGLISSIIHSNPQISSELTLLNQQGSNVELGEVVVVPLDQTLLYVQTIYVESSSNQIPTLKDVVVVYDGKVYHSSNASLDNALCQITNPDGSQPFSSYCNTAAAVAAPLVQPGGTTANNGNNSRSSSSTTVPTTPTTTPVAPPPAGSSVDSLLQQAQSSFNAADAALRSGDLAAYQHYVQQAEAYVNQAKALANKPSK